MKRRTFLLAGTGAAACAAGVGSSPPQGDAPRFVEPPRALAARGLALVLGSGGPRGFAHVGALRALAELDIQPDLVVGSSVGAVIGALVAGGIGAREIEQLALALSAWDVMDFSPAAIWSGSYYTGRSVARLVQRRLGVQRIESLALPFAAVATELPAETPAVFNAGDLALAIQASAAIADTAPPVTIDGKAYCDGDLACPLPARIARRLGARRVIAVDVSAWDEDTPGWVRERRPEWIAQAERRNRLIADERPAIDRLLRLRLPYLAGFSESYRRQLFALGYQQTLAHSAALQALR